MITTLVKKLGEFKFKCPACRESMMESHFDLQTEEPTYCYSCRNGLHGGNCRHHFLMTEDLYYYIHSGAPILYLMLPGIIGLAGKFWKEKHMEKNDSAWATLVFDLRDREYELPVYDKSYKGPYYVQGPNHNFVAYTYKRD